MKTTRHKVIGSIVTWILRSTRELRHYEACAHGTTLPYDGLWAAWKEEPRIAAKPAATPTEGGEGGKEKRK